MEASYAPEIIRTPPKDILKFPSFILYTKKINRGPAVGVCVKLASGLRYAIKNSVLNFWYNL